jgi:anti-sigma-K factor RskA
MRSGDNEEMLARLVIPERRANAESVWTGNPTKTKRRATVTGFVRVPMSWKEGLTTAKHAAALKLALELLFESWRTGEPTLVLSSAMAARAGVQRRSKLRGLKELERIGLVTVDRHGKRAPRVTLVT